MLFATYGEFPSESFFAGLDMLADLLDIEPERSDGIGHEGLGVNKYLNKRIMIEYRFKWKLI